MERIILDTDIGKDADDAIALTLALKSPEIQVEGVTTAYGHVNYRARVARKISLLCDRGDIQVYAGLEKALLRQRDLVGYGHEVSEEILNDDRYVYASMHAIDFIIETILNNPGEITLVCIAPLSNIAAAIIKEPRIVGLVKKIVMMGGVTRFGSDGAELPYMEFNIKCDPEAAAVVFSSKAPIFMVGLDVTMQVKLTAKEYELLAASVLPVNQELAMYVAKWQGLIGKDSCAMHDPLAVSVLIDPSLVKFRKMAVHIEYDHRHPSGQTIASADEQSHIEVASEVNSEGFMKLLLERLF